MADCGGSVIPSLGNALTSRERAERLAAFLTQEHPGEHRAKAVLRRLAAVGFEPGEEVVKKWIAGASAPDKLERFEPLIAAYGVDLLLAMWGSMALVPEQLDAAEVERKRQELARAEFNAAARASRREYLNRRRHGVA